MDEEDKLIEALVKPFFDGPDCDRVWFVSCCGKAGVFKIEPGKCTTCGGVLKPLRVARDSYIAGIFRS